MLVLLLTGASEHPSAGSARHGDRQSPAPVGIVSAIPVEQAAVLARMDVKRHVDIDGYRFYVGTMRGRPVVSVASGSLDSGAELATWILNKTFRPRATLFSGTAGSQNARVHIGDVVLSGYVVDKEAVHYRRDNRQEPYPAMEMHVTENTNLEGAVIDGYGKRYPTPSDAANFDAEAQPVDRNWVYIKALAATRDLVRAAADRGPGSSGGETADQGPAPSAPPGGRVLVGTVGEGPVWTENLDWIEAQNMLYQSDAEENEGAGFAFANATAGVPWLVVRGISDSPWHPDVYRGGLAARRAAEVCADVVARLPARVSRAAVGPGDLDPVANARRAGYLIADQVRYDVGPVTEVTYPGPHGPIRLSERRLRELRRQYERSPG
ncbi:hypothetical protein [Streptomyces sp. NPDC051776]|uniref:5'-methylthioadenosine/S-adenosylhomocysteine nucleosidase family protein n=1 Tax=Streptomyces sp. NPDC051776 TaxID=3155414 RepID=UPI003423C97A